MQTVSNDSVSCNIADYFIPEVIGIDQNKHRNPNTTWWNTYLVRSGSKKLFVSTFEKYKNPNNSYHFNEQLSPALHQYGNVTEFYEKLGWTEEELQAEIMFTEETLQGKFLLNLKLFLDIVVGFWSW